ncbi:hypothetical protein SeMB42_g01417 [Synchytrium endobioticum]|uniref:Uncharacterized protein n=1 Tax=Synchytrium endobioticum TaxID=286115 RepID=A0A507DL65_9FUNG|nr:hypothetical protein SeLEV6574_g00543 [Synchytrium endobioticum]TPX52439.1 hypothetical protein SeMB42_g01417 [Synchytrium endobioticum]
MDVSAGVVKHVVHINVRIVDYGWLCKKTADGKRLCASCNPASATRSLYDDNRPDIKIAKHLAQVYGQVYHVGTYAPFRTCDDKKKPDIVIRIGNQMIIVEVDEFGHANYNSICEWSKLLMHIQSGLAMENVDSVVFIRINPHAWKVNDKTQRIKFEERVKWLANTIDSAVQSSEYVQAFLPKINTENTNPTEEIHQETLVEWLH